MDIKVLPDDKLKAMLEKYTEKNTRYKFFVNEETDRTEQKLVEINSEIKYREEFRKMMEKTKIQIPK